MNINTLLVPCIAGLLLVSGCSKSEEGAAGAAAPAQTATPAASEPAAKAGPQEVTITANDQMKFSVVRIEAAPGQELHITLENIGTLPKAAMGHNLVLLQKGTDVSAFSTASMRAAATEYIPAEFSAQIIAHTPLLGPKEKAELVIKAPTEPGEYPYVCSFPAHALAGMRGVLVVR